MLSGIPRERTFFDWERHHWVRCTTIDIGRPDDLDPVDPELLLDAAWEDLKTMQRKPRPAQRVKEILAYMKTADEWVKAKDIGKAVGLRRNRLSVLLNRHPQHFEKKRFGSHWYWRMKHEHTDTEHGE